MVKSWDSHWKVFRQLSYLVLPISFACWFVIILAITRNLLAALFLASVFSVTVSPIFVIFFTALSPAIVHGDRVPEAARECSYVVGGVDSSSDHLHGSSELENLLTEALREAFPRAHSVTSEEDTSDHGLVVKCRTRWSRESFGELVVIRCAFDSERLVHLRVESRSRLPSTRYDWGKNARNVQVVLDRLDRKLMSKTDDT
jgi:hypothetical protein